MQQKLRYVEPYFFEFETFAKERWFGEKLSNVFAKEFGYYSLGYYEAAILEGRLFVNDSRCALDYELKQNDVVCHRVHRHEPPVLDLLTPERILHEDDTWLVIDKPPSVPVHPCGAYCKNSVTEILKEMSPSYAGLHLLYRLDRLTSGLLVLCKRKDMVKKFRSLNDASKLRKVYLAKAKGLFNNGECITVDVPIKTVSIKLAIYAAADATDSVGKPSKTLFRLLAYDREADESVVECVPLTGRTHQIRVHLQYLGHPIVDDPIYGRDEVWGPLLGRGILSPEALTCVVEKLLVRNRALQECNEKCTLCGSPLLQNPDTFFISLHAYRYSAEPAIADFGAFDFKTPLPAWARDLVLPSYM